MTSVTETFMNKFKASLTGTAKNSVCSCSSLTHFYLETVVHKIWIEIVLQYSVLATGLTGRKQLSPARFVKVGFTWTLHIWQKTKLNTNTDT